MTSKRKVSNLLALAVLSYLSERPMHPYELGRTLRDQGDERSIKYNPGSLYMVVRQLAKAGYVAPQETSREGQRPERTVYALTDAGRDELRDWLRELIEQPRHEYGAFVAALSLIAALPPSVVLDLLRARLVLLDEQRTEIEGVIDSSRAAGVPGLFLVEEEYRLCQLESEAAFVHRLIERITDPSTEWMQLWSHAHGENPPAPEGTHA